jgi:hypothetical protein
LAVASYAYLLLAALRVYGINEQGPAIPVPKWQAKNANQRVSAQKLLQVLRSEIWAHAIERLERDSSDFVTAAEPTTKSQESEILLESAAIFARAG